MKSAKPFTTDPSAPPARLADLCELRLGVQIAPPQLKGRGPSLQGMRIVRGRDLFLEAPVGEELLSDAVAHRGDPNLLRLRQGDVLFPVVARRLHARIVDSSHVKRESGVWTSEQSPAEALFEHTDAPCKSAAFRL